MRIIVLASLVAMVACGTVKYSGKDYTRNRKSLAYSQYQQSYPSYAGYPPYPYAYMPPPVVYAPPVVYPEYSPNDEYRPVCGALDGDYRTFSNTYEFVEGLKLGYGKN